MIDKESKDSAERRKYDTDADEQDLKTGLLSFFKQTEKIYFTLLLVTKLMFWQQLAFKARLAWSEKGNESAAWRPHHYSYQNEKYADLKINSLEKWTVT